MKKTWAIGIAAALVVVVGACVYLFVRSHAQWQVEQQVRELFTHPPAPFTKATYDKLEVEPVSHRLSIDGIVLERSAPPYRIKIARLDAIGIDTDALQALFDPARYQDGASDSTLRKLIDTLVLTKVESDARELGRATFDRITVTGIQAHQFAAKPDLAAIAAMSERDRALLFLSVAHVDRLEYDNGIARVPSGATVNSRRLSIVDFSRQFMGGLTIDDLEFVNQAKTGRLGVKHAEVKEFPFGLWLDFAQSGKPPADMLPFFSLGGLKVADLKFEPNSPGTLAFWVAEIDVGKVSRQRLEKFSIAGIDYRQHGKPEESVTIGAMEIVALDWEKFLPLIGDKTAQEKMAGLPYSIEKFSLRNVGGPGVLGGSLALGEMFFSSSLNDAETRTTVRIDRFDVERAKLKEPHIAGLMTETGYDRLRLALNFEIVVDRKPGGLAVETLRLTAPDAGDLQINAAFSDVTAATKPGDVWATALGLTIQRMNVSWRDDGLTERLLKMSGAKSGTTAEDARDAQIMQLKLAAGPFQNAPQVMAAMQAMIDYLTKPGTITMDLKPDPPVTLAQYFAMIGNSDPHAVAKAYTALGITLTAQ